MLSEAGIAKAESSDTRRRHETGILVRGQDTRIVCLTFMKEEYYVREINVPDSLSVYF